MQTPNDPNRPVTTRGRAYSPKEAADFLLSLGVLHHSAVTLKRMRSRLPDDPLDAGPAWYRLEKGWIAYFEQDLREYATLRLGKLLLRAAAPTPDRLRNRGEAA